MRTTNNLIETTMQDGLGHVFPAAALHINVAGQPALEMALGWLDPQDCTQPTQADTFFDLASLTKLFTTTAFLKLVQLGETSLDTPVSTVLADFQGLRSIEPYEDPLQPGHFISVSESDSQVDASQVTFRHLLTHTSGLPAWRPFYPLPPWRIQAAVLGTSFAYPTGSQLLYSDLGFIILRWAIEKLTKRSYGEVLDRLVLKPLNNPAIQFGPVDKNQAAPTEYCTWRQQRIRGEVHDENAWALGGISGHAGLFGTAAGVATLGQVWLNSLHQQGLLSPDLTQEALKLQAESEDTRRGLGWLLRSPNPAAFSFPMSEKTFYHTGFTGTSLLVDPARRLVAACLTNEVYNGRTDRQIMNFRTELHQAIADSYKIL